MAGLSLSVHVGSIPAPFPDASNTGPTGSLAAHAGRLWAVESDFTGSPGYVGGSGTDADPHVIESVGYTSESLFGDFDPGTLAGKVYKLRNCYLPGPVRTGDLDGLQPPIGICINGRAASPPKRVIFENCRFGPPGVTVPNGGPDPAVGGMGYVVQSQNTPFTLLKSDVWGGAANLWYANDAGAAAERSYAIDTWLHDQWVSGGAHTDNINGADPTNASNVTIDHCTVDGACGQRTNHRVVNCLGIYNTNAISGWYILNSLIKNGDFGVFWAGVGVGGAISDMRLINNTFDLTNLGTPFLGRVDILTQSGNVDQNGNALVFS